VIADFQLPIADWLFGQVVAGLTKVEPFVVSKLAIGNRQLKML